MDLPTRMIAWTLLIGLGTIALPGLNGTKPMRGAELRRAPQGNGGQEKSQAPPAERPNPDASGVYHAGAGISPPQATYTIDPEFSDKARRKKLGGTCVIGMVVDTTGIPQDVHVVQSIADSVTPKLRSVAQSMDAKAVEAVKQYKFKPAMYQGKAVPFDLKVEINFRIY